MAAWCNRWAWEKLLHFFQAGGSYSLTPFYDIISAFPVLGRQGLHMNDLKLAMSLKASKGRKNEISTIYPRHFLATAKEVNFSDKQMTEILHYFAENIPRAIDAVTKILPVDFSAHVYHSIVSNLQKLHAGLQRGLADDSGAE